jgi:hypothetical protein
MANADGNFDETDLSDWAERTGGEEPGVSLGGLDEPLPGAEGETEEEGEGVEAGDPCEALRDAQKAIEKLDAIELDADADPKLVKRLDDLRDDADDLAKEAGELADDIETDEKDRKDAADDEEDDDESPSDEAVEDDDEEPDADDEGAGDGE